MIIQFYWYYSLNKKEDNYKIYYKKKLVNYIQLEWKCEYILHNTPEKFDIKGIIKYKIIICERREIPVYFHQLCKYIIKSLNFLSLKNEVIRWCSKHEILINEKLVIKNFFYKDKTVTNIEKENIGVKIAENILKKQSGNVHILRNIKYNTILKFKNIINLKKWSRLSKWRGWTR